MPDFNDSELLDAVLLADVRASVPPMRPEFRAELDSRVARGFKPEGGLGAWVTATAARLVPPRRMLLPTMGAATTLIVALVVVVGAVHDSRDSDGTVSSLVSTHSAPGSIDTDTAAGGDASTQNLEQADPLQSAGRTASVPASPEASGVAGAAAPSVTFDDGTRQKSAASKPGFGRKVERHTELTLSTSAKKLQDTADGVVRVTQGVGGIVENSNVDSSDAGGSATFTLTIPSNRLDDAVEQLSKLAHVSSMSQGATDITRSFVSAADKLSDARAERKALLKALGVATTPERIETLKARLRVNRSEIAGYNGQLKSLRRRADNTTVNVTLNSDGTAPVESDGGWTFGGAADDALSVLQVVASIVLISAAILVPVGLLLVLALLATRATTRRRREQALDRG